MTGGAPPTYQAETDRAAAVRVRADKINAQPDAPHTLRDPAAPWDRWPTRPRPAPKPTTPNQTRPTSPGYMLMTPASLIDPTCHHKAASS